MTTESRPQTDAHVLEITVHGRRLPVSYLSSLLRVVQAAVREVARHAEGSRDAFAELPQPVLHMVVQSYGHEPAGQLAKPSNRVGAAANTRDADEGGLTLHFSFADPVDSTTLSELSSAAFEAFAEQMVQMLKGLPQRGLWGQPTGGAQAGSYDSEIYRRLDQVRLEMRRFSKATLSSGGHVISFEGDRMDIS